MRCPNCGSDDVEIIEKTNTKSTGYSPSMAVCAGLILGPAGLLCGFCGDNQQVYHTSYYVCNECDHRWKV